MVSGIEQSEPDVRDPSSKGTSESKPENYTSKLSADQTVNLDFGDPTLYEEYWKKMENKCDTVIPGSSSVSYFSDTKNFCWFLEPELETQIRKLHSIVGNAAIEGYHIVVGVGSSQLLSSALYALCPKDTPEPISVVSAVPYYSPYPALVDHLQSRLYKWAGDANTFNGEKPYIEIVCSPNNPDGLIKQAVVNKIGGKEIHDLAYYWPQYTAITAPADHDLMLFTASKLTGHAGSRIGWALVRDEKVAKQMVKYSEITSIGVSKDAQIRIAQILDFLSHTCSPDHPIESVFDFGLRRMTERWDRLRDAIFEANLSGVLRLPEFPENLCRHFKVQNRARPAFAWIECRADEIEDLESFLRAERVLTRNGKSFGSTAKHARVSMVGDDATFHRFIHKLSAIIINKQN